jgi:hypothetical protein
VAANHETSCGAAASAALGPRSFRTVTTVAKGRVAQSRQPRDAQAEMEAATHVLRSNIDIIRQT